MNDRKGMLRVMPFLALLLLLVSVPLAAQPLTGEYRIGPRDLLEIKVLELPELNVERRVGDTGAVSLPLVGDVPVAGLTATESADRLSSILTAKYVNRANVTIVIKEYTNKPISVLGAVQKPGSLNVSGKWDLLQAISAAGGLGQNAGKKIYVLRRSENGLSRPARDRDGRPLRQPFAEVERDDLPVGRHQHPGPDAGAGLLPRRGADPGRARLRLGRPDHPPLRDREGGGPDRPGGPGEHPDQAARARRQGRRDRRRTTDGSSRGRIPTRRSRVTTSSS